MASLTGCSSFAPDAVFPLSVGVLEGFSVNQQRILWVELVAAPTKLCAIKVRGPLYTAVIGHTARVLMGGLSLMCWRTKPSMLSDMAGRANDASQLELRIELRIFCITLSTVGSRTCKEGHLLTQGGVTGQTKNRLLGIGLRGVDNLPPGTRSHGLAVKAFLPVSVLIRVAAPAGLGTEGGLFLRKARWRCALQRDGGLPVVLKKAVDVRLQ